MTPDRWPDIERIFLQAVEAPPEHRDALLTRLCADDAVLLGEVRALLDTETEAAAYFDRPSGLPTLLADAVQSGTLADDLAPGTRIDAWELLEEAGRGGMGAVYRASRADGLYAHEAALKLVKRGMDTDAVLRRFHRERSVLAGLRHPHIAQLYDGGTAPDGRPYFVMEFVRGAPLTDYADAHRLTVDERLALFLQACEAVTHAHRSLVVHRDLKPSNILVAEDDSGHPHVKLLDFGLAKLLADEQAGHTAPLTGDGPRLLTPEYAAPEQIEGGPVTTAIDVYALGAVLYELLAGTRPYTFPTRSLSDVERIIREVEPARPSVAAPPTAAEGRATTPDRLRHRLRGDLDTICLQALQKDPARRYASAEALADDLRRHLDGHPVQARPASRAYRAATFVRRHRWGVGMGVALAVLLAGTGAALAVQNHRVKAERDRATAVSTFLVELFDAADPKERGVSDVPVGSLLDAGAIRAEQELADNPTVQATLLHAIGDAYAGLERFKNARDVLARALTLQQAHGTRADVAQTLFSLAEVLRQDGAADSAVVLHREALALRRAALPSGDPAIATSQAGLGRALIEAGAFAEAEASIRAALARYRAVGNDRGAATALTDLASALKEEERYDEAETVLREALAIQRRLFTPPHSALALSLNNLAGLIERKGGDLDESIALHREALAMRRVIYGDSSAAVVVSLSNLSNALRSHGDLDGALGASAQAYALSHALFGAEHPRTSISQYNLGLVQDARGDVAGAEASYLGALASHRVIWGSDHPYTAFPLTALGRLYVERGDGVRAEPLLREALALRTAQLEPGSWLTADAQATLGRALAAQRRFGEAEPLLTTAYATLTTARGPDDRATAAARKGLATLYAAWGRPTDAARYR